MPANSSHTSHPTPMATYVIGDVQGCYAQLLALCQKIEAMSPQASIIYAGDLVNRGPQSLETLRFIKNSGAKCVLGNHDLHLLAVSVGARSLSQHDTLNEILQAPDREELLSWLRHQSLALWVDHHLIIHAGLFPSWTCEQALQYAAEIEQQLQSEQYAALLHHMYGNTPHHWQHNLKGYERYRAIINAFTRMRFCYADGAMDFKIKESVNQVPKELCAWYTLPQRQSVDVPIIFGHWSTLGLHQENNVTCVDTGCVWGGKLTAIRLSDHHIIQVKSPQHVAPF